MNENLEPDPLRESNVEFESLRLRLSRLPQRPAPAALMQQLKKEYIGPSWSDRLHAWFTWHFLWKPVGALALAALLAGVWISRWKAEEENFIDAQPLLTAHARYQAESLVPQGDMGNSNFGAQLAVYYGDEK